MAEIQSFATSSRDIEIPVYAGSEVMSFSVTQMPPGIRIYVYVNGVNITHFTAPADIVGATLAEPIITDQLGTAIGYLYIPSLEGKYKFLAGEMKLSFGDSPNGIASCKYISETILMNHGLGLADTEQGGTRSLRTTEKIRTTLEGTSGEQNQTQKRLDPLSQTFTVDSTAYPLGIITTGLALFVYEKDSKFPLSVELRPVLNGKPSTTEYYSGSVVTLNPANINVYDQVAQRAAVTNFTFEHPIYLKPGEYAFCVFSKSNKYKLLSSSQGDGRTVKQPFAGKLFKPQNTGVWQGTDTEDLTFYIRKAKFQTGTITFEMKSPDMGELDYNRLRLLSTEVGFGDTAYVDFTVQTTEDTDARNQLEPKRIIPGDLVTLEGRQSAKNKGDITLQVSMTSKSKDVSPILDRQLMKAQAFRNLVNAYSSDRSATELNSSSGRAESRYVSKIVSLADGFDSTGLEVTIDVNRKTGTDIEVFARVLAREDTNYTAGIKGRNWTRMPLVEPSQKSFAGTDDDSFTSETYRLLEPALEYTSSANVTSTASTTGSFETFSQYQVKVVFYANNPVFLPKIKNLVAISLL
jgi:hypothetical protein